MDLIGPLRLEEVVEMWGTMQDLVNLKSQVSYYYNMQSLENLCLVKVVQTIKFHCKAPKDPQNPAFAVMGPQLLTYVPRFLEGSLLLPSLLQKLHVFLLVHQDPFKDLPPAVMTTLQRLVEKNPEYQTYEVLPFLVSGNSERFVANFYDHGKSWTRIDVEALLIRIKEKGKNLTELVLDMVDLQHVTPYLLEDMMKGLVKLTSLVLQGDLVDNSVVAIIGSCCPQLRKLTLAGSEITDEGLRQLYDPDLPHGPDGEEYGKCRKLTHLKVRECFRVTIDGIVALLSNLPDLIYLNHDYLYVAIAQYAQTNEAKLKLQYLNFHEDLKEWELGDMLTSVVSKVPDTRILDLDIEDLRNVDEFIKLKDIKNLRIAFVENLIPLQVTLLTTHFSHQLTNLCLAGYAEKIDVSVIGYHCLLLTELTWGADCTTTPKYQLVPFEHFAKLKKVVFQTETNCNYTFLNDAMLCVLASPELQYFYTLYYIVHDRILSWLAQQAKDYRIILSNLQVLALNAHTYNVRDMQIFCLRAMQILCVTPKLRLFLLPDFVLVDVQRFARYFDLHHCTIADNGDIGEFEFDDPIDGSKDH